MKTKTLKLWMSVLPCVLSTVPATAATHVTGVLGEPGATNTISGGDLLRSQK